ncbi:sensor histidine kinase [Actinoallomurus rhizosphaericola]|uniref:sensor histidine kinase n=1 Tax=Actinoallomurus rhizosphaericola TaxID=2952536 RepID=UPI0020920A6A|nr:HAMP domain-containing sensor histidine kinase [Actinoallomurus rhizosphaericola]MCO5997426.1 HAMP domain-containing histidine kinase [Actinoallomurus rhizosphaericola]
MTALTRRLQPTIRVRLMLVYGGLFLVGGLVLLAVTYLLVKTNTQGAQAARVTAVQIGASGAPTKPLPGESAAQVLYTAGQTKGMVLKAREDSARQALDSLLTQGGIALGVVGAAALGLGWFFADRALRPLHRITDTARRVARSRDLTERITYDGPRDDVKELADTFDTMLERLARAFEAQRRFVDNASHELRTPLAINRTLIDVAVRRPDASEDVKRLGESLLVVGDRHERLIEGLLTLAGSENIVVDTSPLDLGDVGAHVLDQAKAETDRRDLTVHRHLGRAPTEGDPVLLERLVQNLVENATRYNVDGGEVWLSTRRTADGAEVVVANTGPVVPAYEVETLFEPFRRLRSDRVRSDRGTGLGLSIVRAIATAHGGTVTAVPRAGGGLSVTVRL